MSLTKRNGVYYAQKSIPEDLRHFFGKSNFRRSTGCRDKTNAAAEAAPLIKEWQRQIDLARQEPDALLEELVVAKARINVERADPSIKPDEWGYLPAEAALEGSGMDDTDWLSELPPSQAKKYADILWGAGIPLPHFMDKFITDHYDKYKAKAEAKRYILEATLFVPTLEQINTENARAWIRAESNKPEDAAKREDRRRSVKTMQKATGYLSEYVLWLQDQRLLSDNVPNPFRNLRYPKSLKRKEHYVPMSLDEILLIRDAAVEKKDDELVTFIDIGRYTGLRLAEVGALSSASVVEVDGIQCFKVKEDAKTEKSAGRLVPIAANLKQLLPLHSFDLGRRENAVGKRFGRLKATVLPDGHRRAKCFHSIRKYVATTLEQAGIPEGVTADLVGHEKPTLTYGVYSGGSHLRQLAEAVAVVSDTQPLPETSGNVIPLRSGRERQ